jgi:hypothetical protein
MQHSMTAAVFLLLVTAAAALAALALLLSGCLRGRAGERFTVSGLEGASVNVDGARVMESTDPRCLVTTSSGASFAFRTPGIASVSGKRTCAFLDDTHPVLAAPGAGCSIYNAAFDSSRNVLFSVEPRTDVVTGLPLCAMSFVKSPDEEVLKRMDATLTEVTARETPAYRMVSAQAANSNNLVRQLQAQVVKLQAATDLAARFGDVRSAPVTPAALSAEAAAKAAVLCPLPTRGSFASKCSRCSVEHDQARDAVAAVLAGVASQPSSSPLVPDTCTLTCAECMYADAGGGVQNVLGYKPTQMARVTYPAKQCQGISVDFDESNNSDGPLLLRGCAALSRASTINFRSK